MPTEPSSIAGISGDADARVIPMTRRPDGTFRKERKVRPGYIPPEDVVRYSNRVLDSARPVSQPIVPATSNNTPKSKTQKKNDKRKAKRKEGDDNDAQDTKTTDQAQPTPSAPTSATEPETAAEEPVSSEKKLRALNKKLRQIEQLKERQDRGETMLPEQTDKISKMDELVAQIQELSLSKSI
ncbi:hypothetical protein BGZ93_010876 [Podila epicladia]|nr:hypothetical protein BGZ92_005477 [Podila epicladia]KAG0100553.1 hypothetical protein BGZ93_010876 [Podila epicladia]